MKLYHGTRAAYLPSIKAHGLVPCAAPGNDSDWNCADTWESRAREGSVFVTPDPKLASCFAERLADHDSDKPVILTINLPEVECNRLCVDEAGSDDSGGLWKRTNFQRFEGVIKPEWITAVSPALPMKAHGLFFCG